jgi:hypothetical protein
MNLAAKVLGLSLRSNKLSDLEEKVKFYPNLNGKRSAKKVMLRPSLHCFGDQLQLLRYEPAAITRDKCLFAIRLEILGREE